MDVLTSYFFMGFRQRQPYTDNHLRPCCIIDNPHVLRDIVAETGAHPTHNGTETVVSCTAKPLAQYAGDYKEITHKVWEEEYVSKEEGEADADVSS